MKLCRTKAILMITVLVICSLFCKTDGFAKQVLRPNNKLEKTNDYSNSNINRQYKENKRVYGEEYTDILMTEILGFNINDIKEVNKDNWFYYNKLDNEQKKVYETLLLNVVKQQKCTFMIPGFTKENIWNFLKYIQYDHEKIFWIDWTAPSTLQCNMNNDEFIFHGQSYEQFQTTEDIYKAWNEIKEFKEIVLSDIEELEEVQIEKQIYKYIATHTTYDIQAPMNQSLYSTVLGKTVCTGYAKMFKYLCNEAGIDCICIFGQYNNGEYHLWNIVNLDNQIYMVDCTSASTTYNKNKDNLYDYINKTMNFMDEYYIVNDFFKIDG